jgi:hypothetical protein
MEPLWWYFTRATFDKKKLVVHQYENPTVYPPNRRLEEVMMDDEFGGSLNQ